jgi:predicted nuclease of predicted toxin-antitoxin system
MRVLLDECIDEGLCRHFAGHQCQTCRYAGLKGLTNGQLLTAAEQKDFEVLITVDKSIPQQQRLGGRVISVVILNARTTNLEDLLALMPDVLNALQNLEPGKIVRIGIW